MLYQFVVSAVDLGTKKNPKDATGAFLPWAKAHMRALVLAGHDARWTPLDLKNGKATADDIIPCDVLVFYGHGYRNGLQLWPRGAGKLTLLGEALEAKGVKELHAYACTFAGSSKVDEIVKAWPSMRQIWGHTTAGHCAWNPFICRVTPAGKGHPRWTRDVLGGTRADRLALRSAIQSTRNDKMPLFARLPSMSMQKVLDEIRGVK